MEGDILAKILQAEREIQTKIDTARQTCRGQPEVLQGYPGSEVAGESENYGTEQEHLNNVFGARLRITALRAPAGPGIEFLEYLAPRDGRPPPVDTRANDLWHWQIRLAILDGGSAARDLRAGKAAFVSPGVIAMPDGKLGFGKGVLVRDPDGHAVQLVEK